MKYFLEKTNNNRREKKLIAFTYFYEKVFTFLKKLKYLTVGLDYINKIIVQYINCKYLKNEEKKLLKIF